MLDKILGRKPSDEAARTSASPYFKTATEYCPVFTTPNGAVYEEALTRAAIEKFAALASKLKPEVVGSAKPRVRRAIKTTPNDYMSWPSFIQRCATLLLTDTTVAIVPSLTDRMEIEGLFPLKFDTCEIVEYKGEAWARFTVRSGDVYAVELANVCLLTRFQYESDFFGGGNSALKPALELLDYQRQANEQAVKNGAKIQFIGQVTSMVHPEDLERKRDRFSESNLSSSNTSGLLLYDQTFSSLQQIEPMSYTVDTDEMERIEDSVFSYFGINKSILQSDFTEEQFSAYYESQIEPFAVQLGEGLTRMLYTPRERSAGNRVAFSANRLEYATNASKRNMIRDMLDRRVMTVNEAREILQLPPIPGGDVFIERGEYVDFDEDGNMLHESGGRAVGTSGSTSYYDQEEHDLDSDEWLNDNDEALTDSKEG